MNGSLFRLIGTVPIVLIFALYVNPGWGQEWNGYRVFWPNVPPETDSVSVQNFAFKTDANGNPTVALIVGNYYRADREGPTAYIYDHFGLIDPNQPQKFWELRELIGGTLPSWVPANYEPVLFGVNANGRVCGDVRTAGSTSYIGFYVDLNSSAPVLHPLPDFYTTAVSSSGYRVNQLGEILIRGTSSGVWGQNTELSIYDPDASPPTLTHVRKNAAEPMLFHNATSSAPIEFNSSLEIVAHLSWSAFAYNPVIKHRVVPADVDSNGIFLSYTDTGVTQWLSDSSNNPRVHNVTDINEFSQLAGDAVVPIRKNQTKQYAALIAPDGTMDWKIERVDLENLFGRLVPPRMTNDLNDAGDILYKYDEFLSYYMHNGDPGIKGDEILIPDLNTVILEDSDPTGAFRNNTSSNWRLSDRDSTGFGWIAGISHQGVNPDGSTHIRPFLLIPDAPGANPGFLISPTNGLQTSEAGGQASFDVVLNTEPFANVTFGISSSDTTEGIVGVASLTFTPANWDIPQTVTITGVDDLEADGDVLYSIITAAATSSDPDYNGIKPDDVSVTNLDDELPPILVYNSTDTPLAIPDPGTRTSTIAVNEDLLVANVRVTLNINHNRAQDMDVFLIAPDGTRVELFTDVGGNGDDFINTTLDKDATISITQGTAPFTGSFRPEGLLQNMTMRGTQGNWKLEVTDDSSTGGQNAAGSLMGWTLTIEAF